MRRRNGATAISEVGPLEGMNLQDYLDHCVDFNSSQLNKARVRTGYELDTEFDMMNSIVDIIANNFLITVLTFPSVNRRQGHIAVSYFSFIYA